MLNRDVILTEYRADARNFQRGAKIYDQTLAKQHRLTHDRLGRVDARWERSTRNILATRTALSGLTGLVGGTAIIQLRKYAEEWRDVERRLQSIGVTGEAAQQSLVDLAIRTRSSVGGTAAAVQRLAKATGGDIEITTRRVETLQKLLATGGARGSERASVSLQLGQALQSGVLSGDEFRSIRENAPVELLDALAAAAGVTRAELRGFAEDQKLTTDIVLQALDSMASTADEKFGALAISGEEAFTVLNAGLVAYAGKVDESLGATAAINGAIASLGEYMARSGEGAETMAAAIKVVGAVSLATAGSRGLGALTASFRSAAEARRENVVVARTESRAAKQAVIDARQELAAKRALRRDRQIEHQRRVFNNLAAVKSEQRLRAAIDAEKTALDRLSGAQARATVTSAALTAAQRAGALTTRAWAATQRVANGVMAFFGGPIGLAIAGLTLFVSLMATAKSPAERLESSLASLSGTLAGLEGTMARLEGTNSSLASDYAALERAQDTLAEATRRGGDAAVDAATRDVAAINTRIRANEKLRRELAVQARLRLADAQDELEALRLQLTRDAKSYLSGLALEDRADNHGFWAQAFGRGFDEFGRIHDMSTDELNAYIDAEHERARAMVESGAATEDLTALQQFLINGLGASQLQVAQLSAELEALVSPAAVASDALDGASGSANGLAAAAANAQAGIAGLIAAIPGLREAQRVQQGLAEAEENYQAALQELNGQGLSGLERIEAERELADLRSQARSEIIGDAPAIRDADKALKSFTDRAHLNSLSAQEQAVVRQTREYEALRKQLEGAGASQERLAEAEAAHRQSLANIEERFAARGSRGRSGGGGAGSGTTAARNLAAARGLLVENGQKAIYIEQELNAEHERLRDLLPALIDMGLSRADAEAVLNSELERTEERLKRIRSASEEAAYAFARGVLQDIRAAEDLNDAIGRISDRLLDLAFDKSFDLLAEQFARIGSAASQGAGSGPGGFPGNILGLLLGGGVKAATGGLVNGPGTSTSDSIPAWLSDGEFVTRAASVTPQTLPMLEAINRGAVVPRFAAGGQVGRGVSSAPSGALVKVEIHNHASNARVEAKPSQDGRGLKVMIWDTVSEGIMGGRFDRPNQAAFGLKRKPRGG